MNRIHGVKYKVEYKGQPVYFVCKGVSAECTRLFDMTGKRITGVSLAERQAICDKIDASKLQPVRMIIS